MINKQLSVINIADPNDGLRAKKNESRGMPAVWQLMENRFDQHRKRTLCLNQYLRMIEKHQKSNITEKLIGT